MGVPSPLSSPPQRVARSEAVPENFLLFTKLDQRNFVYPHESRKTPLYTNIHIAGVMIECCDLDGVSVGIVTSFVPHFNSKVCLSVCPIFKPLCP